MTIRSVSRFIAAGFGSGYAPKAPGTFGTIAAVAFWYLIFLVLTDSLFTRIILTLLCCLIGFITVYHVISDSIFDINEGEDRIKATHIDPSWIVVDEWAGMFVALLLTPLEDAFHILAAFFLFRFFDISKIGPVGLAESLGGTAGIMVDDIVAGILALILLEGAYYVL